MAKMFDKKTHKIVYFFEELDNLPGDLEDFFPDRRNEGIKRDLISL